MAEFAEESPETEESHGEKEATQQQKSGAEAPAEPGPHSEESGPEDEAGGAPRLAAGEMFVEEAEEGLQVQEGGDEEYDRETMAKLYDDTLKGLKEGSLVRGRIIEVDDSSVLVDIGYKSEGILPRSELEEGSYPVPAEVGQEVDVVLEARENQDGQVLLSKRRADRLKFWEELKKKFENDEPVEGTIISRKRGGYTVDIHGIKAFLPGSQLDLHPVRDMDEYVGKTYPMKILSLKVQGNHRNIVLSRRAVLEADLKDRIEATLAKLQEGRIVRGIVKNITDWGVFIDLGGIDGLLHRTDISWGRTEHPSQYFKVGDEVEVIVLKFDREKNQVSLGYKQKKPDPWLKVEEKYYEGARVKGRVVSLKQYGAFVELEDSVQGLLHVSEMSWTKRIEHPSQVLTEGQEIEVVVLRVDAAERKISLGLKQLTEDPWKKVAEKYPVGSRVTGIIREINNIGCKVEIDEDISGFLHRSNITWSRHMRHPADILELGDTLELVVLEADPEARKLSLGLKQIKPDPWEGISEELKPDMILTGKVINILDFGAFVEVKPGVEGLVHISEIADRRINHPSQVLQQDQEVKVKVLSVNEQDHRLSLSIRECLEEELQEVKTEGEAEAGQEEPAAEAQQEPLAEAEPKEQPAVEPEAQEQPEPDAQPSQEPSSVLEAKAGESPEAQAEAGPSGESKPQDDEENRGEQPPS